MIDIWRVFPNGREPESPKRPHFMIILFCLGQRSLNPLESLTQSDARPKVQFFFESRVVSPDIQYFLGRARCGLPILRRHRLVGADNFDYELGKLGYGRDRVGIAEIIGLISRI